MKSNRHMSIAGVACAIETFSPLLVSALNRSPHPKIKGHMNHTLLFKSMIKVYL